MTWVVARLDVEDGVEDEYVHAFDMSGKLACNVKWTNEQTLAHRFDDRNEAVRVANCGDARPRRLRRAPRDLAVGIGRGAADVEWRLCRFYAACDERTVIDGGYAALTAAIGLPATHEPLVRQIVLLHAHAQLRLPDGSTGGLILYEELPDRLTITLPPWTKENLTAILERAEGAGS